MQKVVSVTTSVTTILWLSGLAALAPMSAMAVTINEGDTIRVANTFDVYIAKYVGSKMFKRLILNPDVFNSYQHLSWGAVKTVTQAQMDALTTSSLVRALGDTKVYQLTPNGDVGTKQWLNMTAEAFTAAGYDWDSIYVINNVDRDNYTTGADITGGTSASPSVTPVAGSVNVSLASDTPAAAAILTDGVAAELDGQALIPALKLNFTAPSSGAVTVTTLKLTRGGISSDSDIDNVYLYDGDSIITRLAEMQSVASKIITFSSSNGLFTVPAGSTKTILVRFDINRDVLSGKTMSLALNAASDVVSNASSVAGSFPLTGNIYTTATATDFGGVKIAVVSGGNSSAVDPGTTGFTAARYQITPANQNLQLKYLKFQMVGSAAVTDVTNLKLYDGATQLGSTQQLDSDKNVTFDLTGSPLAISSSQTKNLDIKVDVVSGSTRDFTFYLQKGSDAIVYDTGYGIYLRPYSSAVGSFSAQASTKVTIGSGAIVASKATDSPNNNIADNATGLTFAKFALKATGENVKINQISYACTGSTTADKIKNVKIVVDGVQQGTTDATITCNTYTAGSVETATVNFTVNSGNTVYLTIVGDTTDSSVDVNDTYYFTLTQGYDNGQKMSSLSYFDVPDAPVKGNVLTVKSGTVTAAKNAGFGDATSASPTGVVGRTNVKIGSFTVQAGAGEDVNVSKITISDDGAHYLGKDFQNLKIMHGADQFGATIGTLQTATYNYKYEFSPSTALRIANGNTEVFDVYADILTNASDTATSDMELVVYSVTATGVSTGSDASDTINTPSLQNIYIAANGSLLIEDVATSDKVTADMVYATGGTTASNEVPVFKFKTTAYTESVDITRIIVSDLIISSTYNATTANGKPTTTLSLFKLYDGTTLIGTASLHATSTPANGRGGYIDFNLGSANQINVQPGQVKTFTLKAMVNSYDQISSGSTHTFALSLTPLEDGTTYAITARGHDSSVARSGPTATAVTGNPITVRKSYPIVQGDYSISGSGKLINGTVSLAKFSVSAMGNDIALKKIAFDVALTDSTTSTFMTLSAFKLFRNGVEMGTAEYDIYDGTGSDVIDELSNGGSAKLSTNLLKGTNDNLGAPSTTSTRAVLLFVPQSESVAAGANTGEELIAGGQTNTYEIKCTVTGANHASTDSDSIVVTLLGESSVTTPYTGNVVADTSLDTSYHSGLLGLNKSTVTNYNFIWSSKSAAIGDHKTTVPSTGSDWTNGYEVRRSATTAAYLPLDVWNIQK